MPLTGSNRSAEQRWGSAFTFSAELAQALPSRRFDLPGGDVVRWHAKWKPRVFRGIVVVTDGRARPHQFKTLCHEVAHALLHADGDHHSAPEREVEAESTAFVVCHALGLDTGAYSFPYVATWAHGEDPLAKIAGSGERIRSAAL